MKKKASLNLSVNAIVILVLAVVLLGLALAFIRGMFGKMTSKMGEIVDITQIEAKPTPDTPITIPNKITVKQGGNVQVQVGFYNRKGGTLSDVTLNITSCVDESGNSLTQLPTISAPKVDSIDAGKATGFNAIFSLKNVADTMTTGNIYICQLSVTSNGEAQETKQFYVEVTS